MPLDGTEITPLMLPRIGVAIGGAALLCPALTLPLVVACLVALGRAALEEARADNRVPELPPPSAKVAARRLREDSTEDSFPTSDPPSWTPVTGTRTRH